MARSKCLPIFLFGLECYPLVKLNPNSLDFVIIIIIIIIIIIRVLMKLLYSANIELISDSRLFFNVMSLSEILEKKRRKMSV